MNEVSAHSIFLYLAVFLFSTVFGCLSQKEVVCQTDKENTFETVYRFRLPYFIISFLILWGFTFFSSNGEDYKNYVLLISRLSWNNYSTFFDQEPLFNAILLFLKDISSNNIALAIALNKTITLCLVFLSIYISRKRINIGFSIFCYDVFCYLESFYLLGMFQAAALILLANSIRNENSQENNSFFIRTILPLILVVLSTQIHNSAYIYLVIYVVSFYIQRNTYTSNIKRLLIAIGYILANFLAGYVFSIASNLIGNFHYDSYYTGSISNIGTLWFLMYIPLFFILYLIYKKEGNTKHYNIIFLYIMSSALFRAMSYSFTVVARVEFLLISLYCIFISDFMQSKSLFIKKGKISFLGLAIIIYVFARGVFYFVNELQWIGEYCFINPFIG